ncbi:MULTISPECIES: phage head closure protein [unclassified Gemella]|uniref:phage head closure protein n=1 Tax=unclassified Gemella TaxID=2624949 RepID=UPI0010732D20|nr:MULTISPECIES: phage head closure protein [unclassified Gemella]MBF0710467.1 phage head closure protein [Gemella sp. GL1.1]MBF0746591.1 phage head closure protein [Gemella sp. 19428wG2_WT2a]NYS27811.1 phage head closure protein [Gemella sp. GL1]TFU59946.1 head-tail adaptor protein [Gemella sp. WT2a]
MEINKLNQKIKIEKQEESKDELGIFKASWEPYFITHAYITFEGIGEINFKSGEVDHSSVSFTIRYQRKTKELNTSDFRVLFNREIYNILSIDRMNYKNKYIKLRARKVKR